MQLFNNHCSRIGSPNETIYADAKHYWSMDTIFNIIDHKVKNPSWGIVEGDIHENDGVNDMSVELTNGEGKLELLSNEKCFWYPNACSNSGITLSFWFKSIVQGASDIQGRVFFQTNAVLKKTGFYMLQGDAPGEIIFEERRAVQYCQIKVHSEPNLWSFFTLTYAKVLPQFQVSRNGVNVALAKTCTSMKTTAPPKGQLVLGNGGDLTSALFDEVAMWDRKLSDEEIKRVYNYYYKGWYYVTIFVHD